MDDKRRTQRFKPIRAVTVAVETDGLPAGYGVVADISEGGACVITDMALILGTTLMLAFSFPSQRQPFTTPGTLRWIQQDKQQNLRYGLQFEPGPWTDQGRLKTLIGSVATA